MKNILRVALLLATNILLAQNENDKKIFLDSLSIPTTEEGHHYIRIIKDFATDKEKYEVTDYYRSGQKKKEFTVKDKEGPLSPVGDFTEYNENGNKELEFKSSNSEKGIDISTKWHKNGKLKEEVHSDKSTKKSLLRLYYENGNKQSVEIRDFDSQDNSNNKIAQAWSKDNIQTVKDGKGIYNIENASVKIYGTVADSLKQGEWTELNKENNEKYHETFDKGKFIKGEFTDSNGEKTIYTELWIQAKPEKGIQDFGQFIAKNFIYTAEARRMNIEGKIIVEFIVEKDGNIDNIRIFKGLNHGLDQQAIKAVSLYEKWIPGKVRGKNARFRFALPIMAKLQ
ncbi:TonB family protein [Flavobacterium amniphilum]|uniref:energy transducer TonB n=1 Tax=Flavobacterium amniphilum TaxID=1834035 RepID=UPI002029E281|nr:energy transducer TonB [Flavobacterium amniphilum]MCL9806767.1 TonB family protein [Flavobacterium amniphilum]